MFTRGRTGTRLCPLTGQVLSLSDSSTIVFSISCYFSKAGESGEEAVREFFVSVVRVTP
jgi:hypothetical protein